MNILLTVVLSIVLTVGATFMLKAAASGTANLMINNNNNTSNNLLGEGKDKPKAKILDKTPLGNFNMGGIFNNRGNRENPANANTRIPYYTNNGGVNAPGIPDMSDESQQFNVPRPQSGGGMGVSASATIAAVSAVGVSNQTGSGNFTNIVKSGRLSIKNMREMATMLVNNHFKAKKGVAQQAANISNEIRKNKVLEQQGNQNYTTIRRGKDINQLGTSNNFIQGKARVKANESNINTPFVKMRPISRVQSLNIQNYYAKEGIAKQIEKKNRAALPAADEEKKVSANSNKDTADKGKENSENNQNNQNNNTNNVNNTNATTTMNTNNENNANTINNNITNNTQQINNSNNPQASLNNVVVPQIGMANPPVSQTGEGVNVNVNDVRLNRNNDYRMVYQQIYAGMQFMQNEVQKRQQFDADPKNASLNDEEKNKVYNISQTLERRTSGISDNNQYVNEKQRNERILDVARVIVKKYPQANEERVLGISETALMLNQQRGEFKKAIAFQNATNAIQSKYSPENKKKILDQNLNGSAAANIRMEDWVNKNFSDQINNISDERMEEIRKEAEQYELNSREVSLSEREANHDQESNNIQVDEFDSSDYYGNQAVETKELVIKQKMEELTNQEIENNRQSFIEAIKDQFIENPEDFRDIFGDEFVDKYNTSVGGSDEEIKQKFIAELAKIENGEQNEFLKNNPDKKNMSKYELFKARKRMELNQDIDMAARDFYNQRGQMQQNLNVNNPQPQVMGSGIYIPRYVQDAQLENQNS